MAKVNATACLRTRRDRLGDNSLLSVSHPRREAGEDGRKRVVDILLDLKSNIILRGDKWTRGLG